MSDEENPEPTRPEPEGEEVERLTRLLAEALRALGDAGEPQRANRIGGRAWWALHERHPQAAQRINGLMHRLVRQENAQAVARSQPPAEPEPSTPPGDG